MLQNILKRSYHFFLYVFAFVILTLAIFITVIRLALPEIGSYRQQTQDWISQYMNYPVEISNIDAHWDSWTPKLRLYNVRIIDPVSNEKILGFHSVLISIDILSSLYENAITLDAIIVSGLNLTLVRRKDGSITALKYFPDDLRDAQTNDNAFAKWFLAQKNILIEKAQITLLDMNQNGAHLLLSDTTLRIRNNSYRTQIEGTAILPMSYENVLNFALDAKGNILTSDWFGEIYLAGKDINIAPLLAVIDGVHVDNQKGVGNVQLWSTWDQAQLRQIEGQFDLNDLTVETFDASVHIDKLSGNFSAIRKLNKSLEISLDVEELITNNGSWPASLMSLKKIYIDEHDAYKYIANASYLNLDDMNSFVKVFAGFSEKTLPFHTFEFAGNIKNSVIQYDPTLDSSEKIYIETDFSKLVATKHNNKSIRLEGLSGHLQGTQKQGSIHIASKTGKIMLGDFLSKPLMFHELDTNLNWKVQDNNLSISTQLFDIHTPDFDLQLKGNLQFQQDKPLPLVNVLLELSNSGMDKIASYLPTRDSKNILSWFKNLLVAGEIPAAEIVFRGWLADYPFQDNEGVFEGYATVNQVTLDYDPRWPPVEAMDAEIIIQDDTLTINASSANFDGIVISEASAVVENLTTTNIKKSMLINGHIDSEIKDGLLYIENSPLRTNKALKELQSKNISGGLGLDLSLNIPLISGEVLFNGILFLRDVSFESEDTNIKLSSLNGAVDFSQDSIFAEGITGKYFNHPMKLAIRKNHNASIITTLSGNADSIFISEQLIRYFPSLKPLQLNIEKRITGSCFWEASLISANAANDVSNNSSKNSGNDTSNDLETNQRLTITSSLEGLAIDLPSPLSKSFASKPLELSIQFPEASRQEINIQYADILNGIININELDGETLIAIALAFGGKAVLDDKSKQIAIGGHIDQLIVSEWLELISENTEKKKLSEKDTPVHLDIQVSSMELINHYFSDVSLKLNNTDLGYHVNINAEDIDGDIDFGRLPHEDPVHINLQKLTLIKNATKDEVKEQGYTIIPNKIPPLNIEISELIYNDIELGKMHIATSKTKHGLAVDNINFNKEDMTINGVGTWDIMEDQHHSEFDLSMNAASMKIMLETFDYDVAAIEEGEINLSLDAKWQGTPAEFALANLHGTLYMKIDKGRFKDIQSSAGRLFGLLSLQTLPRRLSLDFSDLFSKGLAFDNIEGHFSMENGDAYTSNLLMTGPSVNIHISGRTGLVQQDYDQIAIVTPKIADNLPVASALFGPGGISIGAAIFLVGKIFHAIPEKIDTFLRKQYTITGAWDDPQITKIKLKEEEKKKKKK